MSLVDYGSSSEEDEQFQDKKTTSSLGSGQRSGSVVLQASKQVATKRPLDPISDADSEKASIYRKKISLPPLPSKLTDLYKDRERPPDNPERHQGRVRTRPHVDGSWPVHVYLEVKLSHELFDIVSTLTRTAQSLAPSTVSMLQSIASLKNKNSTPVEAESAEDASELHISLTRPIYLQELHLGRFTSDLESLVAEMDVIAQRYSQPKFYPDPEFHASFAWALGGGVLDCEIVKALPGLDGELGHDLRHCSIGVRRISWKIGQKTGSVDLLV
ncbi:poly(U)-specific 3'-to-5' RNA exonuclease [Linnemannia zychae]|nr:poly(U)-specific 3'-to-5' RNA exonuclease [Linnemannia zychae]